MKIRFNCRLMENLQITHKKTYNYNKTFKNLKSLEKAKKNKQKNSLANNNHLPRQKLIKI